MRKYILSFFFSVSIVSVSAQELQITAEIENPSNVINNGIIELNVDGGVPPYTYKWSNQSTSLESNRAEGLTEGMEYSVMVTDTEGNTAQKFITVPAEAITEHLNGVAAPAVESLGSVLFWDPFSAIGIYDPVKYSDAKMVSPPTWTATEDARYVLQEWLQPEGAQVEIGDPIAIITKNGEEVEIMATATGELQYLVQEGGRIFDSGNPEDVIEQNAQQFAAIQYDEPVALTHPNGDPQKSNIPFIVVWLVLGALFFTIRESL